jgi:hypothetical protein
MFKADAGTYRCLTHRGGMNGRVWRKLRLKQDVIVRWLGFDRRFNHETERER